MVILALPNFEILKIENVRPLELNALRLYLGEVVEKRLAGVGQFWVLPLVFQAQVEHLVDFRKGGFLFSLE